MAAVTEREQAPFTPVADPAPLGLAAFALTTFLLSGHNASCAGCGLEQRACSCPPSGPMMRPRR